MLTRGDTEPPGDTPDPDGPETPREGVERRLLAVMLEEVRITGLGVIDDALLELSPGYTALTGETGAGKTMVVTGLGLLFGGRADPSRVRPGEQRAAVEGRLRTEPSGKVARQVEEAGGELDEDGTLVLTRSVSAEGRSRAFAGGRSVPVSLLTYLADDLVAVHGQSDQQQLLKPGRQREALDKYAGAELAVVLGDYQRAFSRHRKVHEELMTLTSLARSRAAEAEALRAGLTEIEKLDPAAGEEAALRAEEERLSNADALHAGATVAHEALLGDPTAAMDGADAITLLGQARRALDEVRRHDAEIDGVAGRLSDAAYLVSEVAAELASYIQGIDADPVPTFVFDEVDAGVGGKAAVEIGRRLAKLARLAQVIVVTHLPQVAAFADNHLVVAKSSDGSITSSGVIRLDHDARVRELSRMLAGLEDSEFGQAHAAELLALAAEQAEQP